MSTSTDPIIGNVRRHAGIAGQFAVSANVCYPGEDVRLVTFVGSVYGGPVVMQTGTVETFVTDPDRFGKFGEDWVRAFFSAS